jgi:Arc/MetJ-type ribon-helix-helix transcriptional regulator
MTIHLSKDQERFVHKAVLAGLYASEDDLFADAVERLRQAMPKPALEKKKNLTEAEFKQHLLESGRISSLPTPADPASRPAFQPITLEGEPLSETIIRERR